MAETGIAPDASRPRVFISYSREDSAFAGRLALILNDRGFETVIDREELDADEAWKARVRHLILSSDLVIVLLTAASAALESVRWESDLAAGSGKRIVVVVPAPLEDGIVLPQSISASPWFHFYKHPTRTDSGIYAGPALENALRADLEWRRQYTRLFLLAGKWKDSDGADELLRGDALAAALSWRASTPRGEIIVPGVADFLDASEQAEAGRAEPAGTFESRLVHLEERRAAAEEAARAKKAAAQARREDAPPAPTPILTPRQLANVPLAPVQTPKSLESPSPAAGASSSPDKNASRRKANGARGKSLAVPALIVLLMFAGAGAVVWQVVPQYLTPSARTAAADPSPAAPVSGAQLPPATPAGPATAEVAVAETSEPAPAPPEVSPPPAQAAAKPAAPKPDARDPAEPASAANLSPEEADWAAAREVGNIAAYRTYMLKWPKGRRSEQALSSVRRRIETLSTKPESKAITLSGPVVYRELPTFRDKGAAGGAAGQTVNFIDRIASPREGEWLVLERDGAWPFRFVSLREIEAAKQ
ncbi:MAG TPA: toll/interleukin-1 receptor domain-containing protein [Hyphomonadaceae bacterium]